MAAWAAQFFAWYRRLSSDIIVETRHFGRRRLLVEQCTRVCSFVYGLQGSEALRRVLATRYYAVA